MSEPAGERLARMLALVPWLMAHDGVTVVEAARHFGVAPEVLERDLWLLVVSGLPGYGPDQLVDIDFWDDGEIHVIDPQTLDRPLRLTPDEAVVLLVSLRMLAQVPGVGDREAILSASAKIEAAVAESLPAEVVPSVDVRVEPDVAAVVEEALSRSSWLRLLYAGATRDDLTERDVMPRSVRAVDGVGYLEAWCSAAQALRTFRLDRIVQASLVSAVPEAGAAGESEAIPGQPHPPQLVALIALEPMARWVLDVHEGAQVVDEDAQGRVVAEIPVHSLDWGLRLVLSLGGHGTALAPEELVTAVRLAAESALTS